MSRAQPGHKILRTQKRLARGHGPKDPEATAEGRPVSLLQVREPKLPGLQRTAAQRVL